VDVNDNACRFLGYTRDELLRTRVSDIDPPENRSNASAIVRQLFSEGSVIREQTLVSKDGRRLPVEISSHVFDLDGSPTMISSVRDISDRKAAQARLQAQHERFQSIIENTDAGYFRIGLDGCFKDVNPAWLRMYGFTRKEEAVGLHFSAVQKPDDLAAAEDVVARITRGESHGGGEFSRMRRDGTVSYHTFSANPVFDGTRVIGVEGFLLDISDRKMADQARQRSEERYSSLFDSVNEGIALHRLVLANGVPANYVLLDVNRRYEEIVGIKREHVANRLATEVYATPDAPYLTEYASVVKTGEPLRFETYFAPMDKHFVVSVARMGEQEFATIFFDVTEQKRTQEALQRASSAIVHAERHYRLMFNSGSDAVLVHKLGEDGLPGRFSEVNDNACRQLGYSREELLRMRPVEIDAPEEHAKIAIRARALAAEGQVLWEGVHIARDGQRIPVEVNTHLVDLDGSKTIISCVRDITERKEAEAAKASLEEQLRQAQKLESVGRLAGGVAHDFNNLLTVINGYSDFLLLRLSADDPSRRFAEEIKKAGERATSLTKQLLAFSRKQVIEPRVLDLGAVIAESVPMLERLIGEDIVLETHLDGLQGQVMADPDQLHQVLMNLAVNARDAMPDGGRLTIETGNVHLGRESTAVQSGGAPGRYILMAVSDTGQGMDQAVRQQIFEPFFTTKELGRGTGLGLSTVYGIVRQSGGWIDVWSEVGVGSSFNVYLPRIDACPVPEGDADAAHAQGGGETILVVEDQEAVRSFAKTCLEQYGYHVIDGADGEQALAAAKAHPGHIDLLLVDVVLPGMNGRELAERLKELRPSIKVLFVSGYTADVIAQRGVLERGVAFLHKPFTPGQLTAKVRDVLATSLNR
ncbi:MAG TPA: PAS domain S-box protein, partial [Bryobacteraceae bacterium]|nr:PAS domain S-box protein [Bryobacteraceae bacterium]